MVPSPEQEITVILQAWQEGDPNALGKLMPLVYNELRRIAGRYLRRERSDHTLQPTALVNEAYLRLASNTHPRWQGRLQFYAVAAQMMRRILVDHARSHRAAKRGSGAPKVVLEEGQVSGDSGKGKAAADLLALNDGLEDLRKLDERKSRIIDLRFFGGLTIDETAAALKVSSQTVINDTRVARAWLHSYLNRKEDMLLTSGPVVAH